MCEKCNGKGRLVNELMRGVWEILPCSCAVTPEERDWDKFLERWGKREKSDDHRKNDSWKNRELLPQT